MLLEPQHDQDFLRETTAKFLEDKVPPSEIRALRDDTLGFARDYWSQGVELGWTHLLVSEEMGGGSPSGNGLVDLTLIAYEFGLRAAPGPLLSTAVVLSALSDTGADQDLVNDLLAGEQIATWAHLEGAPAGGLDTPGLRIEVDGSELVLNGAKRPVESANAADHLLVTGQSPDGLTQVLVPASAAGVTITPLDTIDLTRRFSVVTFDNVRVPIDAAVGEPGGADAQIRTQLLRAITISNAESVGAMQRAFDMTLEWTFDRYSFGRPLASYQAIKHRMASMKMWLEASHAIADKAAAAVARDAGNAARLTSAAKAYIGDFGSELLQECVQLHGGIGVTFEHDLHFYLRRHTLNRTQFGKPSEHRRRIAEELRTEVA
jgi:alkylation response protein AidB-like acyl-CoA dehydrogenase